MGLFTLVSVSSRDRLVVRTLRCGRSNPGSNPGHGSDLFSFLNFEVFILVSSDKREFYLPPCKRQWYSGEHSCLPSS